MLVHTDFGHDPDDAIAIAYLIENGYEPDIIGLTPGHIQQQEALSGFLNSYKLNVDVYLSEIPKFNEKFNVGKHKIFFDDTIVIYDMAEDYEVFRLDWKPSRALIIGPAKNIGNRIHCDELYFQGGYCPKSIKPLEKFKNVDSVQSFNPCGAKTDFNQILESKKINTKYYIGKNVCHGFKKSDLERFWKPKNKKVRQFFDLLEPEKAMHDVLAAILFVDNSKGIWIQEKPFWKGNKLSTVETNEKIYSLIGI